LDCVRINIRLFAAVADRPRFEDQRLIRILVGPLKLTPRRYLSSLDENDSEAKTNVSAFTQALAGLGWTDGRNVRMDLRWGGDDTNRIRALARELVGLQPDVIVTGTTAATAAVQRETRTIPIVFANVADPVATGIVPGLNQPGGNVTGFANYEATLAGKWLELLSEIAPGLKRAAIMFNPDTAPASAYVPSFEMAARSLKVVPISASVHSDVEIETAIIALGREPGGGLVIMPDVFTGVHRAPIISAAARNNVPAVYHLPAVSAGAKIPHWKQPNGSVAPE
jgi:putative ABC transport system substrate-binding protein